MRSFHAASVTLAAAAACAAASCKLPESSIAEAYTTIQVSNPLSIVRTNEPIEIPLREVRARFRKFDPRDFSVHQLPAQWYPDRGDHMLATNPPPTIPAQVVDKDGDGEPETLLAIADFAAGEKRFLAVASPRYSLLAKPIGPRLEGGVYMRETLRRSGGTLESEGTYVEVGNAVYDPAHTRGDGLYQCDGPIFETDTSGWRLLFDSRLCLDVIGKRDRELRLHAKNAAFAAGWLDLGSATWGGSLLGDPAGFGAGAFGYVENGTIVPMAGFDSAQFRMIQDGPAATEAEVVLFGARLGKGAYDLRWRLTHYAGGRTIRHDVTVSRTGHALGFAMSADAVRKQTPSGAQSWMRIGSFGPSNVGGAAGGSLGLGILASGRTALGFVANPADVIGVAFDPLSRNFTFHTVAAWDGEPLGVRSQQEFERWLDEVAVRLDAPIKIANLDKAIQN